MKGLKIFCIGVIILGVLAILLRAITIKIEPGQVGVVTANFTVGLVEEDYGQGFWWAVGPMHKWDIFDTTVQTLHMKRNQTSVGNDQVEGPLVVRSRDGANVNVDLSIKYQIKPGEVWQLRKSQGAGDRYKAKVRNESVDVLRQALGTLFTEDFYRTTKRQETSSRMETALQSRFDPLHVKLVSILIRDISFDEAFEKRIKEKVLATQEVELNQKLTEAAEARGLTQKVEAETAAKVQIIEQEKEKTLITLNAENNKNVQAIEADYKKAVEQTRSDGDLYTSLKEAEGIELLRKAEADSQTLRRAALAVAGADNLVALELAKSLQLGAMSVSTQAFNPIDVAEVLRKLGLKQDGNQ